MAILRPAAHKKQSSQLFHSTLKFIFFSILSVAALATSISQAHAGTITVPAGGDFQAALNNAQPGETIILQAGAIYTGPFTLPKKDATSSDYITIRTSTPDSSLPSPTTRISPTDSALLPKLLSPGSGQPALQTAPGAHHYRLIGLEIRTTDSSAVVYDLVELGNGDTSQDTLDKVPHHLTLDRCLLTAFPTQTLKRGIALHSAETTIENSYIAGFKSQDQDAQAIAGWNGPGPFHILNNYLEASGENLMWGGSTPAIAGLVPSDIEVRGNYLYKPMSWRQGETEYAGIRWSVKNLFELKSARRVVFEGNVLENCWSDVNSGYGAINLTVRGDSGPQATLEEITIRNNIVKHTSEGFNILGHDDGAEPSQTGHGIRIENNLFLNILGGRLGGDGAFLKINGMADVVVNHNTIIHDGNIISVYGIVSTGFVFTNNIVKHNDYGIIGQDHASGTDTLKTFFPAAVVRRNVIVGADMTAYPTDNFYPTTLAKVGFVDPQSDDYRLRPDSAYKGKATDRKDIGCDLDVLKKATAGVVSR
jgi:hypothetical protein